MKNKNKPTPIPDKPDFSQPPAVEVSILLSLKYLKAMDILASKDSLRYLLNGVLVTFDRKNLLLIATDGRQMGIVNVSEAVPASDDSLAPFSYIVPSEVIQDAVKLFKQKKVSVWLEFDAAKGVSVSAFGKSLKAKVIDGNYPKWKQVVPRSNPVPVANVNLSSEILERFAKVNKILTGSPLLAIRGHNDGSRDPEFCPYTVHLAEDFFLGIIMPIRTTQAHILEGKMPTWVR